jgi:excisionase family DNA binding protein
MTDVLVGDGLMTRGALANALGVGEATLRRWEEAEGLPVLRVGRTRLYDLAEVRAWLKRRRRQRRAA